MVRILIGVAAALLLSTGAALAQSAGTLTVERDHTQRLGLRAAAGSVIVGNPAIADVTVVDERTLFVSGRAYGSTEVVVLDALGRTIHQVQVVVTQPGSQVRVWRGVELTEMACGATCAPAVQPAAE